MRILTGLAGVSSAKIKNWVEGYLVCEGPFEPDPVISRSLPRARSWSPSEVPLGFLHGARILIRHPDPVVPEKALSKPVLDGDALVRLHVLDTVMAEFAAAGYEFYCRYNAGQLNFKFPLDESGRSRALLPFLELVSQHREDLKNVQLVGLLSGDTDYCAHKCVAPYIRVNPLSANPPDLENETTIGYVLDFRPSEVNAEYATFKDGVLANQERIEELTERYGVTIANNSRPQIQTAPEKAV